MNVDKYYAHLNSSMNERVSSANLAGVREIRLNDKKIEKPKFDFMKYGKGIGKNCDINIILGKDVEEIAHFALSDPQISSIEIRGNKLKTIGDKAFANSSICSIEIPSSVQEIGKNVFDGCEHLTEIVNLSKNIEITPDVVGNCAKIKFESGHIKPTVDEVTGYKR